MVLLSYTRLGGASRASRGHVESCAHRNCSDPVGFCFRFWCGLGLSLSIYGCIIGVDCCSGALILWGLNTLISFLSVYYIQLYYDKFCLDPLMEGQGRRQAFHSRYRMQSSLGVPKIYLYFLLLL
jgi:hypothetical protein